MPKATKNQSESASKGPVLSKGTTGDRGSEVEATDLEPMEDRIEELEQRIAEMNARLTGAPSIAEGSDELEGQLIEQQNARIVELQNLVTDLGERLTAVQAVNARDEQFKAAVRSVENAAAAVQRGLVSAPAPLGSDYSTTHPGVEPKRDCGCGPCECLSCSCCTFEIWMSHVRVDQMQNPLIDVLPTPADSNIVPWGTLEVWMFATIDPVHAIGACIPAADPLSNLQLHKQITDAYGPWVTVNRCIGTVTVKKGIPLTVPIELTIVERENDSDRLQPGNRDEWGSSVASLTLDCCYSNYPPIQISVSLTSWGQSGGGVSAMFIVKRVC